MILKIIFFLYFLRFKKIYFYKMESIPKEIKNVYLMIEVNNFAHDLIAAKFNIDIYSINRRVLPQHLSKKTIKKSNEQSKKNITKPKIITKNTMDTNSDDEYEEVISKQEKNNYEEEIYDNEVLPLSECKFCSECILWKLIDIFNINDNEKREKILKFKNEMSLIISKTPFLLYDEITTIIGKTF